MRMSQVKHATIRVRPSFFRPFPCDAPSQVYVPAEFLPPCFGSRTRGSRGKSGWRSWDAFFALHDTQHFLRLGPVAGDEFELRTGEPVRAGLTWEGVTRLILTIQSVEPAAREIRICWRAAVSCLHL